MPPEPGQEEPLRRLLKIVNALIMRPDSGPFREPVDWRGLELYDYPEIITKMMDLGTVKRKLERGNYPTTHAAAEDIRLVWNNCMTYNSEDSDFFYLAKGFSRKFEDRYRKIRAEYDVGETEEVEEAQSPSNDNSNDSSSGIDMKVSDRESVAPAASAGGTSSSSTPSLDARVNFGSNLFLLTGKELGHVITTLELECPKALETWGDSRIEVNVDVIPMPLFSQVNEYVISKVGGKKLPQAKHASPVKTNKKRRRS